MRGALSGLTTRGRCLLAAGVAAALCSIVLNERDLLRVAVFVIALPVLSAGLAASARVGLSARRFLLPPRVPAGDNADVVLEVHAHGQRALRRPPAGGRCPVHAGRPAAVRGGAAAQARHRPPRLPRAPDDARRAPARTAARPDHRPVRAGRVRAGTGRHQPGRRGAAHLDAEWDCPAVPGPAWATTGRCGCAPGRARTTRSSASTGRATTCGACTGGPRPAGTS